MATDLSEAPLGKKSHYTGQYDPGLLFPITRQRKRDEIGVPGIMPFTGADIWNLYELSWLNAKGKPEVCLAEFTLPAESPNLIESKSLKLYFVSFNQTKFNDHDDVIAAMAKDLSAAAGLPVAVRLILSHEFAEELITEFNGLCLDQLDVSTDIYQLTPEILMTEDQNVDETVYSNLLKSNCPITNQPDWASVLIRYQGKKINHENLLKYIISFRQHNEFHEQCVERIFMDIWRQCQPEKLTVYARYTRRGGLDINPFRSNFEKPYKNIRLARQ